MTTITVAELNDLWRWCEDIGQFSTDRPINDTKNHEGSCIHRTPFCNITCYNNKLYKLYPNMHDRDDRYFNIEDADGRKVTSGWDCNHMQECWRDLCVHIVTKVIGYGGSGWGVNQ